MKKTEKQKEQNRKYNDKNTDKIQLTNKKNYWKNKGFNRKNIDEMYEKHGDEAFVLLRQNLKQIKEISKLENKLKFLKTSLIQ
jgi:hypothetical protein